MDATAVLGMANWVMAELVRVFHKLPVQDAQKVVDRLAESRIPLIWEAGKMKRVLDPGLKLTDQILLLIASVAGSTPTEQLFDWTGYNDRGYFNRILKKLHNQRLVELSQDGVSVLILPPGASYVQKNLIRPLSE